ncbi:hypothetical protein PPERSA_05220 [Pseudocohnilembus persalinus]|uniref:RRM domain-containing protein n=1 Tax=Pseudocohnilembus persalinus TaxID=266149 RepID=A0A0V0R9C7_PSEPJ|nr:hypothetical protein PPERSA_05220 [Pseudocohnilembus persalinus]|eukprot:KRX11111.1 hypothetical protein PPERSA_05220 [Pseudocohnilembus persalinus]
MNTRLIVKNIPTNVSEQNLKEHFSKFGDVTDVKIILGNKGKSKSHRRFCFIGYKSEKACLQAKNYFNNTYLQASKIAVEFAQTKDASGQIDNNKRKHPNQNEDKLNKKQKKQQEQDAIEKSEKFQEFLQLMKEGAKGSMSWNDVVSQKEEKNKKNSKKSQKESLKQQGKGMTLEEFEKFQSGDLNESEKQKKLSQKSEKEEKFSEKNKKYGEKEEGLEKEEEEEKKINAKRLYIVNIPYKITEQELTQLFEKFGVITELKLPMKDKEQGITKGFCFVQYEKQEEALRCFSELDNQIVMGRILHVRPSFEPVQREYQNQENQENQGNQEQKKDEDLPESEKVHQKAEEAAQTEKSSYKKMKKIEMRKKLDDKTNWNTLFLNPNSILEAIANTYNVRKSEILSSESQDLAVRQSLAEAQIIKETRDWMEGQGLNLEFLDSERKKCQRSDRIILVKNLPYKITEEKLRDVFSHYGKVERVLLSPNRSIGIVEYDNEKHAKNAFQNLSYHIINHNPLYLEWAPENLMDDGNIQQNSNKIEEENKIDEEEENNKNQLSKILYVKNLNFDTTEKALEKHFSEANVGDLRSVKIVKTKEGLSSGYGFIEFKNQESIMKCLKKLQNSLLDDHMLKLSISKQKENKNNENKRKQKKDFEISNKLVVRNLAFESTKKEIRELFKNYGEIKSVRLPQKMNGQHRGFAFVEFVSQEEAKNAYVSLGQTHLYGRKLVIEYAKQEAQ